MPQSALFFRPALIFAALLLGAGIALRDVSVAAESARSVPPPVGDVLHVPIETTITTRNVFFQGGKAALTTNTGPRFWSTEYSKRRPSSPTWAAAFALGDLTRT
jgi:hypothetical protein